MRGTAVVESRFLHPYQRHLGSEPAGDGWIYRVFETDSFEPPDL